MKRLFRGQGLIEKVSTKQLQVGASGSAFAGMNTGVLNVVVGNVGSGTTGTVTTTLTGAASGDAVLLNPTNPVDGLALGGARVSAANQVTSYWVNAGAGEAAGGTVACRYVWFDLT